MKKHILGIFLIFGFMLLSGCDQRIGEVSPHGDNVNQLEGVSLELDKASYRPEGDTFALHTNNQSDEEVTYGVAYAIEYLNGETWHTVNPKEEMSFILIAHILEPGDETIEQIDMSFYEPLKIGHYRLVRQLNNEVLAAEFSITN